MRPLDVSVSPPYYAVIFTSVLTDVDDGYDAMDALLMTCAQTADGFLGIESARSDVGITVSYWRDEASIRGWKAHVDHRAAQAKGRSDWYRAYSVRVAKVERDYSFGL